MAREFIVRPLAEADLEQAANWYDEEQVGLGSRFLQSRRISADRTDRNL